ncbi:MAG: DUF2490 domain-containing protein [Sphingobacteriales bacterium]|nr:MAG: DUF2490 domain-containing protein [Sphingobacteriales bacterium]
MKHLKLLLPAFFLCLFSFSAIAQIRLSDRNAIGWYASFNTIYLNKKTSLWVEYQWRRDDVIVSWQQSLARAGLQFHFKNDVSAMVGYGYIMSFPFGDYPAGPHYVPEHRIFEQLIWNGNVGRVWLNHRLRLQQRFVGKVDQKAVEQDVTGWNYLNRVRYQIRATVPLNHPKMQDKTWYVVPFDEILIGFGKNVNQNIFDQNRLGLLFGMQYNKAVKAEIGYFNQTVQQGALVSGNEVFQYNHGLMLNLYLTKR